jgi:hypothetical protein
VWALPDDTWWGREEGRGPGGRRRHTREKKYLNRGFVVIGLLLTSLTGTKK